MNWKFKRACITCIFVQYYSYYDPVFEISLFNLMENRFSQHALFRSRISYIYGRRVLTCCNHGVLQIVSRYNIQSPFCTKLSTTCSTTLTYYSRTDSDSTCPQCRWRTGTRTFAPAWCGIADVAAPMDGWCPARCRYRHCRPRITLRADNQNTR